MHERQGGEITIPGSVTSIRRISGCAALKAFTVDASNPVYSSLDGVLFNRDQTSRSSARKEELETMRFRAVSPALIGKDSLAAQD